MSYRPEWFPTESVLDITLNVVMYVRGSYDAMPDDHALNIKALRYTVDNWTDYKGLPGSPENKEFDNYVKCLILLALEIEEDYQKEKQQFREGLKELTQ